MKRKPYKAGDWFGVPVSQGFGLGRIARVGRRGGILLGYFFAPAFAGLPTEAQIRSLGPFDAFYIAKFIDRGLLEDGWPIISIDDDFSPGEWPLPPLGRIDEFVANRAYAVQYDERDLALRLSTTPVPVRVALGLPSDGLAGHIWLQQRLQRYFNNEEQRPYDPNVRFRTHLWYGGLPRTNIELAPEAKAIEDP